MFLNLPSIYTIQYKVDMIVYTQYSIIYNGNRTENIIRNEG